MKKTKVENVSGFRLDFFLRQNKKDIRVVLKPGESSWCDRGSQTKSMILYERKHLIKSSELVEATISDEAAANASNDEVLDKLHTTESILPPISESEDITERLSDSLSALDKATKETEEYKQESEKKYKGKKRGRKKKRGPKPGSKRNKPNSDSPETTL